MISFSKHLFSKLSIQTQLITIVTIGSFLITIFFYFYFVNRQNELFIQYFHKNNESLTETIKVAIELGASNEQYDALIPVFEWARKDSSIKFIALLDDKNELIVNFPIEVQLSIDSLLKNVDNCSPYDPIYLKLVNWKAKFGNGKLLIGFSTQKFIAIKNEALRNLTISIVIILIVSITLFSAIALNITKPLKKLTIISASIADGEVSHRADNQAGSIEIRTLAGSFNKMMDNLISSQKERLDEVNKFNESLEKQNIELIDLHNELEKYSDHLETIVAERTQELVVAMTEIEKSSKLKTEIMANMNHEIRTPLNFIKGSAALIKMLVNSENPNPDLIDTLGSLNEGVNRLSRTLELFADLSTIKSGNYQPTISAFNLRSILEYNYLTYLKLISELQKPVEIKLICSFDDAYILADEQNTEKIIMFIIDNAVKFTETGYVNIELSQKDETKYQLTIEDTGIGIDDEYKDKIYEPFSQEDMSATRAYEGIGLSLALAYEYALANKFKMNFESEKGKGTKFILEFDKCNIDDLEI
jgi:signal transduction histidine kinase